MIQSDRYGSLNFFLTQPSLPSSTTTMSNSNPSELRAKYTRFRILVIGRANAGKTTLLQRVCNTTEDPCLYDENNKNLVSVHRTKDDFSSDIFYKLEPTSAVLHLIQISTSVPDPTHTARNTWHQSAVRIQEQPRIYFPRFPWIWDRRQDATAGSFVVYKEESKVDRCRWSAACYLVSFTISAYILATDGQFSGERFCFVLSNSRPLLQLETEFFETARAGKGFYPPQLSSSILTFYSTRHRDLYQVRWSDDSDLWHGSRW